MNRLDASQFFDKLLMRTRHKRDVRENWQVITVCLALTGLGTWCLDAPPWSVAIAVLLCTLLPTFMLGGAAGPAIDDDADEESLAS